MIGRSKSVSLLTNLTLAHSPAHRENLRIINELGDFVRFVRLFSLRSKEEIFNRNRCIAHTKERRYKERDFSLTMLTSLFAGPSTGVSGSGQQRRGL